MENTTTKIVRILEDEIISGKLPEGEYLYSTREIMNRFSTSEKTARRVVYLFHATELLETERGKGLRIAMGARDFVLEYRRRAWHEKFDELAKEAELLEIEGE
ncbi:MAG: GntR family transcriptional regulator [Firmicutes bacterium]|nr:GntR family transcriptional regulator [Bacillota bacterium]